MNDVVELQSDDLRAHHARTYVAISHVRSQALGSSYSNAHASNLAAAEPGEQIVSINPWTCTVLD